MPRLRVREYDVRRLLTEHLGRLSGLQLVLPAVLVDSSTNLRRLRAAWLDTASTAGPETTSAQQQRLVCKPDVLAASRVRESGLVLLGATLEEVERFVDERIGKRAFVGGVEGTLTHFVVEPFIAHAPEDLFDLHITSARLENLISFAPHGAAPSSASVVRVPVEGDVAAAPIAEQLLARYAPQARLRELTDFICAVYRFLDDLEFTSLDFCPLAVLPTGRVVPLDAAGELDYYAQFRAGAKWGPIEFPLPWGHTGYPEEAAVEKLSVLPQGGPTLRLTVVNPMGRVWLIGAGAGSAMIFGDTLCSMGLGHELGNFCEYSGNITEDQTYQLCKNVLALATSSGNKARGRALLVGGCIANYTDVSVTFKGFVHAFREMKDALRAVAMRIIVRRAGPNYHSALRAILDCGRETGLDIRAFGPEVSVTSCVAMAVQHIKSFPTTPEAPPAPQPAAFDVAPVATTQPTAVRTSPGSPRQLLLVAPAPATTTVAPSTGPLIPTASGSPPIMAAAAAAAVLVRTKSPGRPSPRAVASPTLGPQFPPIPTLLLDKAAQLTSQQPQQQQQVTLPQQAQPQAMAPQRPSTLSSPLGRRTVVPVMPLPFQLPPQQQPPPPPQ